MPKNELVDDINETYYMMKLNTLRELIILNMKI